MRVDARTSTDAAKNWRCFDCARREYRRDVVYVDDGEQTYGVFRLPDFVVVPVKSRVALVAVVKIAYINLDADPDVNREPFTAVNEILAVVPEGEAA